MTSKSYYYINSNKPRIQLQKKLEQLDAIGAAIVSLFTGDRFSAQYVRDSFTYSGDFLHKHRGKLFKKPYKTTKEVRYAGGIPTVNC